MEKERVQLIKKQKIEQSRSLDEYLVLEKIGQGTYGSVYRAEEKKSGKIVALKECYCPEGELHITSFREIHSLKQMNHQNIVKLFEVAFQDPGNRTFLVLEYIEHDLGGLLDRKIKFSESEIKQLMVQLLSAVHHIHSHWIVHRDLKLNNLLYSKFGHLKVTDFGLARRLGTPWDHENKPLTPRVQTLWYRAPELLLGATDYNFAIDLWSVGCIFGELLVGVPILPGISESDQLTKISRLLGSPSEVTWPGFSQLKNASQVMYANPEPKFHSTFPQLSRAGLDLMTSILMWNPNSRLSASNALDHDYFRQSPLPQTSDRMPSFPNASYRREEKNKIDF